MPLNPVLLRLCDVQDVEGIEYQVLLNQRVQRRFSFKAWQVVDFEQIGLQTAIDHYVQSENFEAHVVLVVIRLALLILTRKERLHGNYRFDNDIVNLLQERCYVVLGLLQQLQHRSEASLMARLQANGQLILHELFITLIYCIVREVHEEVIEVVVSWLVDFGRKPGQAFLIDIDSQRVAASKETVNSEIEFEILDQKRVFNILLDNAVVNEAKTV